MALTKSDLIKHVAYLADITQHQALLAVEYQLDLIANVMQNGGKITLAGFGKFSVAKRKARLGRNPRTGAAIKIKAKKVVVFTPYSRLKQAIN